ncbi:4'-phosphopantetheinyl transferase superfamily protein [Streptomyces sp. NPDC093109]|uniref:4'-phosphopantetheinyl transferase family protein n=1 Tax=Streptomyces sp. NPDC093109 TaxID=3154977 RepID=UPI00344B1319
MNDTAPSLRHVTVIVAATAGLSDVRAREAVLARTAEEFGVAPRALSVRHDGEGRPLLHGLGPGTHISISHGHGLASVAVTGLGAVGVDVEAVRPLPALRLARRWFTPAEAAWLRALPEPYRPAAYFWLWTHKEATGKALGTGLGRGGLLRPVPLPATWPPPARARLRWDGTPSVPALAVAAPALALPSLAASASLAVAAAGPRAEGAFVDVRVRDSTGAQGRA